MGKIVLRRGALTLLAALLLFAAGCGGSSDDEGDQAATPPTPQAVPQAKTEPEWIRRLINRFLRDMDKNLRVVNSLGQDEVRLYLRTGNETTIRVLRTRMSDLSECSQKLQRVGAPPTESGPLVRVYASFQRSCPHYEQLAQAVLRSLPLISSRDPKKASKGEAELASAYGPSREAARHYGSAVQIIQRNGLLNAYEG
jgi:hypothetical protein